MSYFDDASLVMIPSGYKDQKVYSVKPLDGSGDLTFSRASGATRVASNGLIEKVRTNQVLQSQTFDNASWVKYNSSVTANSTTAPDGTSTADTLVDNTANDIHVTYQSIALSAGEHTISCYAKANTLSHLSIYIFDGTNFFSSGIFNLSNGTVSGAGSIVSAGNGWYRVSFTATIGSGSGNVYIALSNGSTISYAGTGQSIYIWGYQVETGVATDYIATTSAAVSVGPVSGLPRLDYLGSTCGKLLLEPQRTNKITYSENQGPTGTNWYPSTTWTVTNNTVTSPSGYQDADTLTETTSNGFHSGYFNATIDNAYTGTYTISAFAKYNGRFFVLSPKGSTERTYFNLQTGTVAQLGGGGVTAKIEDYGNGWYRCSVTCSYTNENVNFEHLLASAVGTLQYTGNGTSGVHIWGCMAEAGAYATSYIPTLGSSVTRVADACSKTGITSLIGQTEGTFFVEFNFDGRYDSNGIIPIVTRTSNNEAYVFISGAGSLLCEIVVGGVPQASISGSIGAVGLKKIAFAYKANDFAVYLNGVQIGTDTSGSVGAMADLNVGSYHSSGYSTMNGINQALLFKTRLSNSDLATLTSL